MPVYPASDSEADRAAARRYDGFVNRWYWEPPLIGAYPADVLERLGPMAPRDRGRRPRAHAPADRFLRPQQLHARRRARRSRLRCSPAPRPVDTGNPKTAMGWEIYPDHLYDALTRITRDYGAPDDLHHRERRRLRRRRASTAPSTIRSASTTCATHLAACAARDRRRRQAARLLLLVAARQLRVVVRLLEALRPRLRRLRDAAAHRQGERPLLRRLRAGQRRRGVSAPVSAGCVVMRDGPAGTEVLLVHARGATFKRPLFGIPKGLVEPGESLGEAAQRETEEETGLRVVHPRRPRQRAPEVGQDRPRVPRHRRAGERSPRSTTKGRCASTTTRTTSAASTRSRKRAS